eukprot:g69725.t1
MQQQADQKSVFNGIGERFDMMRSIIQSLDGAKSAKDSLDSFPQFQELGRLRRQVCELEAKIQEQQRNSHELKEENQLLRKRVSYWKIQGCTLVFFFLLQLFVLVLFLLSDALAPAFLPITPPVGLPS